MGSAANVAERADRHSIFPWGRSPAPTLPPRSSWPAQRAARLGRHGPVVRSRPETHVPRHGQRHDQQAGSHYTRRWLCQWPRRATYWNHRLDRRLAVLKNLSKARRGTDHHRLRRFDHFPLESLGLFMLLRLPDDVATHQNLKPQKRLEPSVSPDWSSPSVTT
jgi:hypothetical protein